MVTEMSPPAAERATFGSREAASVGTSVDVLVTELCCKAAGPVSRVGMEEVVTVSDVEGMKRVGVTDSDELGITETVPGSSVGVKMLVFVGIGVSGSGAVDLGTEVTPSLTVLLVDDVVVAAAGFTESVHISVSVVEEETATLAASGAGSEIVGTEEGEVVADRSGVAGVEGAAVILGLVGVFISAS